MLQYDEQLISRRESKGNNLNTAVTNHLSKHKIDYAVEGGLYLYRNIKNAKPNINVYNFPTFVNLINVARIMLWFSYMYGNLVLSQIL